MPERRAACWLRAPGRVLCPCRVRPRAGGSVPSWSLVPPTPASRRAAPRPRPARPGLARRGSPFVLCTGIWFQSQSSTYSEALNGSKEGGGFPGGNVTATHRPLPRLSFPLLEVRGFIEIQLTYHKIHPPKVGTSVVCTKFTELCNPFHHPGKPPARWQSLPKVAPRGHAPVPLAACTRPQPPPHAWSGASGPLLSPQHWRQVRASLQAVRAVREGAAPSGGPHPGQEVGPGPGRAPPPPRPRAGAAPSRLLSHSSPCASRPLRKTLVVEHKVGKAGVLGAPGARLALSGGQGRGHLSPGA